MLLDKRSEVNNQEDNRKSIILHFLGEALNISNLILDDNYVNYLPSKRTRYCFAIGSMHRSKEEEIR